MRSFGIAAVASALFFMAGCGQSSPTAQAPAESGAHGPGKALHLTEATFVPEIKKHKGVAMLDFWATWCGPCKVIAPAVEELAGEMAGKAKIAKVDVDQNPNLAKEFKIDSIPCLVLIKDGREIDRKIGVTSKADLKAWIENAASK